MNWSCGELANGLQCYSREEFFQAHEHWETVWLVSQEPEKTFLQALIQVTAAFHHLQRRNVRGATSLLRAALRRLQSYPPFFSGIAVDPLREEIVAWVRALENEGAGETRRFPEIATLRSPGELGSA